MTNDKVSSNCDQESLKRAGSVRLNYTGLHAQQG